MVQSNRSNQAKKWNHLANIDFLYVFNFDVCNIFKFNELTRNV